MMTNLNTWIGNIATLIEKDEDIDTGCYEYFLEHPEYSLNVIDFIAALNESEVDENPSSFTACIFVLDICVAKLQSASEHASKSADKYLNQVMSKLAEAIRQGKHSLSFWLPVLNAFYEVHVTLSQELKEAYMSLANEESETSIETEWSHLSSIRDLINELSDLSVFDIAENFFAQSYAMPADFFVDLVLDLYQIEEGQDIALLTLLHPNPEVREMVVQTIDSLISTITLSSLSLSRLQMIAAWYPAEYQRQLSHWITLQRKKGVVFHKKNPIAMLSIKASEIDGGGAQGIFIHLKHKRQHRLCGLLFKYQMGIKDAWITPSISKEDVLRYHDEAFDDNLALRDVDLVYFTTMTNHFLALTLAQGGMPDLHLLEIQETLGLQFLPKSIDMEHYMQEMGIQISPFTTQALNDSLQRSKKWAITKPFTESWFVESALVDKLVNQCCGFVDGAKICERDLAADLIFKHVLEPHRDKWVFHFLWVAMWMQVDARKNEKMWQDSFYLAHTLRSGKPMVDIPIMQDVCKRSILHSMETMHERRTHLS